MPEMKTDTVIDPRQARRDARLKLVSEGNPPTTVRVWPANEAMRGSLRHANGMGFRSAMDQAVEWPNDSFTARRIRDGDVLTDGAASSTKPSEPDPKLGVREQAAARRPKPKQQPAADESKAAVNPARPRAS